MTTSDAVPFSLSVSLHTLDREQQIDTIDLLRQSSVRILQRSLIGFLALMLT